MDFVVGDLVTRVSHDHDILFVIVEIENNVAYLKGVDLRLYADSDILDLVKSKDIYSNDDENIVNRNIMELNLDRSQYFYLPGKILHIDGDSDYLDRCLKFYKKLNVMAKGVNINEMDIPYKIGDLLNKYNPDIVVITGHDAYYSKKKDSSDLDNYQNTRNFIDSVKVCRKYEKSQDKLIVIAGACQSNYEELIKAGSNFASSPKRINIHALDPAILASSIALSDKSKTIDIINLIKKTKYGSEGVGGIITNGTMYVGFPR